MIAPFLQPDLEWDFRVERVASISTSAHKYGLVYPGLGWVVWRTVDDLAAGARLRRDLPRRAHAELRPELLTPGAQVLLQYYLFLRLGWDGYYKVQKASQDVAVFLSGEIGKIPAFELWNDGTDIPVFAWKLREGYTDKWNLYHLSERLRLKGWLVPAYPMPEDLTDIVVQRIVVRNGLSRNLAESLLTDIQEAVAYLDALESPMPTEGPGARPSRTEPRLRLDGRDRRRLDGDLAPVERALLGQRDVEDHREQADDGGHDDADDRRERPG